MSDKTIIIIGAGLSGLATGIYAQMNGYRSHIVEHHSEPGGVATAWKHGDYWIDGGIHYLMGHKPGQACYQVYEELGVFENRQYPDLKIFQHYIDEPTGLKVAFSSDLDQLAQDLKKIAPEDAGFIDGFIAGARSMQRVDLFGLMETPPELMGALGPVKLLWRMRRVLRYFGGPYNQPVRQFVQSLHNETLRRLILNLFLPDVPMWFLLLLMGLLANGQMGMLQGSCTDFVASMEERYRKLGGKISYRSTVKEIIVENHCATGVRLADDTEYRAEDVVSAGDGYSTIFKLLGGRYVNQKIRERYEKWELLCPIVTLSFGVKKEFLPEPPLNFLFIKNPVTVGGVTLDGFPVRVFNYSSVFAPKGKTVVQALLHTDWKHWHDLRNDLPRYEREKQQVRDDVLARLEPHYPGITANVEVTDIATPYTTWRYTLNHEGAFMGWNPTPKAMRTPIAKTLPGLNRFYMAGQWTVPGGGVPPCVYSGRQTIQILCHRDGKKFISRGPGDVAG